MLSEDDPERRAYVLQGRLQALAEANAAFIRSQAAIDTDDEPLALALAFARANSGFSAWLTEAGAEVSGELTLIAVETGVILPSDD